MYLLDTNVISELTKQLPSPAVLAWFATTPAEQIYVSSVSLSEMALGLALMPRDKRHAALLAATNTLVQEEFDGRCLSFDARAAAQYGPLATARQLQGRPCSVEDAMIAAIALANQCALVTRNTKDFQGIAGLKLVDPWGGSA